MILYFIQIGHTYDFPSKDNRLVEIIVFILFTTFEPFEDFVREPNVEVLVLKRMLPSTKNSATV